MLWVGVGGFQMGSGKVELVFEQVQVDKIFFIAGFVVGKMILEILDCLGSFCESFSEKGKSLNQSCENGMVGMDWGVILQIELRDLVVDGME